MLWRTGDVIIYVLVVHKALHRIPIPISHMCHRRLDVPRNLGSSSLVTVWHMASYCNTYSLVLFVVGTPRRLMSKFVEHRALPPEASRTSCKRIASSSITCNCCHCICPHHSSSIPLPSWNWSTYECAWWPNSLTNAQSDLRNPTSPQ